MKVFITGMDGFVGRYLAEALLTEGFEVAGTVLEGTSGQVVSEGQVPVKTFPADIRRSGDLDRILEDYAPDRIFHLAAVSFVPSAANDPLPALQTNVQGTFLLLEAVRKHCPRARVLFISSSEVYGKVRPEQLPLTEQSPLCPANFYAATKQCGELWCDYYRRSFNLDLVILRPFNHIGPGQSDCFVASSFARQVAEIETGKKEPRLQVGNLEARRDFCDVRDVVRAYLLAADRAPSGEVLHVCSGKEIQIQSIVDDYVARSRVPIEVVQDPQRMRPSDVPRLRGSYSKLNSLTGWEPTIPLEKTLQDILEDWRRRMADQSSQAE